MILTVTLNAALDVTYLVDALRQGATHRVREVHARPGGKGVNVARVLDQLGVPVRSTGFADGELRVSLPDFVRIPGRSRRTTTVVSTQDGMATTFTEPGPDIGAREWDVLLTEFDILAQEASLVVLSGSLPPGVPSDAYARLIRLSPVPVLLDTSGEALRCGLDEGPALIAPNVDELTELLGRTPRLPVDCATLGVPVVTTVGAFGAYLSTEDGLWHAAPPRAIRGNPTGAGDACTAAFARGMAAGTPLPDILGDAVALSAAAVATPTAGAFDAALYRELAGQVVVREVLPLSHDR